MNLTFLDPGQLTARLDLEAPDDVPDGQGGVTREWRFQRSLWAAIEPTTQSAYDRASAQGVTITHRVWLSFRDDIAAGMRFRKGARLFNIRLVMDPDETGRFIVCRCEEEGR
ncbi:phage head closure protein [Agrobacterium larrymoorei]|uniref:phage head closure protein n=1 Tax=Agrobacterium larrymoorei TaxID=160699 RepID=UPI0015721FC6|nr:phage head closure protein [Agrobacterium larrymoorei]NTJ41710.1 phage head closure protein [Agrobacterium larrymoorei]